MPLVPNSLDLHGMVAKENPYGDEKDPNVPATPGIWNPATLQNDAPSLSAARKAKEVEVRKERAEIRQSSEPPPSYSASAAISSTLLARHVTDPLSTTSWSANNPSPLKTTFTRNIIRVPPNESANASTTSLDSTLVDRLDRFNINGTREPSQLGRRSSMPSMYSASTSITGAQMSQSPSIETTPTKRPLARGATYPEISSQPLSTITETPVHEEPARYKSSSHSQDTPSRIRIYSNMPPVPQSAPSSQGSFHRPPPSRSDSYPTSASADRIEQPRSNPISAAGLSSPYPVLCRQQPSPAKPLLPTRPSTALARVLAVLQLGHLHAAPFVSRTHGAQQNAIIVIAIPRDSPASPLVYDDTPSRPAPVKHRRTYHPISPPQGLRRLGFWNRRGDHCTAEGYLVCAPYDESYPSELAAYPENEYQDHFGFRIAFEFTRPELPESLPGMACPLNSHIKL
ncbi:hypothetical protein H0H92_002203 [Tricholoma furcatifolium]|nr:hypothetical protein H0H92_002203 [Tricholoma furcatifolium]